MLNNNAELDNGVYNEAEEEKKEEPKPKDDGLTGLDMVMDNNISAPPSPSKHERMPESRDLTAMNSLNTSQIILDDDRVDKLVAKYGYTAEYVREQLEND